MFFSCPRSRLRIWSHETGSAVPSRVSPLILHTLAESGAYSRDFSRFPRRRPCIPPTAIGSVPSLSGRAIAYRWCLPPRVRRHRASSPQGSSSNGCRLFMLLPWTNFCAPLFSHTHQTIGTVQYSTVGMLMCDTDTYTVVSEACICLFQSIGSNAKCLVQWRDWFLKPYQAYLKYFY